jgi:glutathione S-transferase
LKLIGMLDSPYVRRVAVSLQMLGLPFEHEPLSVFRTFDAFSRINPVVKAPTLVCDDGEVMMDSTLILEYAQALAHPRSLMPAEPKAHQHALCVLGLALAACEKSVQIVYERGVRPPEKQHAPWVERVTRQVLAAYDALEAQLARGTLGGDGSAFGQAELTTAVTWHFTQRTIPDAVPAAGYPRLAAFSALAEARPEFRAAPHGDGTVLATA